MTVLRTGYVPVGDLETPSGDPASVGAVNASMSVDVQRPGGTVALAGTVRC